VVTHIITTSHLRHAGYAPTLRLGFRMSYRLPISIKRPPRYHTSTVDRSGPDHRSLKPVVLRLTYRLNQVVSDMSAILSLRLTT